MVACSSCCGICVFLACTCVCRLPGAAAMRHEHILAFVLVAHKPNTFSFCWLSTLLRHHQGLVFSFLFFSGQGCAGNYKSIEAWPGLYNLCGILSSVWEQPPRMASAQWSGPRLGFSNKPKPFFMRNSAEKECSICTSGPENFTKADHQLFLWIFQKYFTVFALFSHDFWILCRLAWLLIAGPHPAQSVLYSHLYRSTSTILSPPPLLLLCSCAVVVNKACPLASSFLWSPPLYWGRNCGRAM